MPPTSVAATTIAAAVKRPNVLLVMPRSENLSTAPVSVWGSVKILTPRARALTTCAPAREIFTRQIPRNEPEKVTIVSRPGRRAYAPFRVLYCCAGRGPTEGEGNARERLRV